MVKMYVMVPYTTFARDADSDWLKVEKLYQTFCNDESLIITRVMQFADRAGYEITLEKRDILNSLVEITRNVEVETLGTLVF